MARVYKIRPAKQRVEYSDTPVENPMDNLDDKDTLIAVETVVEDETSEENTEIVLETIPVIEPVDEDAFIVENPEYENALLELLHLPDRWYIKQPEDKTSPPIINFYKGKDIIASLPLTEENLSTLMPVLDNIYVRPEEQEKLPLVPRIKKWMKKHIFSTILIILFTALVLYGVGSTAVAAFFVK